MIVIFSIEFALNAIFLFVYQVSALQSAGWKPLCMVSLKRTHFPVVPIQVLDCFSFDSTRFDCTNRIDTDMKNIQLLIKSSATMKVQYSKAMQAGRQV